MLHLDRFGWIDLENAVLYGVLDLGEHVIPVAMDNLEEFAYLSARIRKVLLFTFILTFLLIIHSKSLSQDRNERAIS